MLMVKELTWRQSPRYDYRYEAKSPLGVSYRIEEFDELGRPFKLKWLKPTKKFRRYRWQLFIENKLEEPTYYEEFATLWEAQDHAQHEHDVMVTDKFLIERD